MEKLKEKKVNKKLVKDLKLYGGAVLLTSGIVAGTVLINEKNTDHSEAVCLMTEMFGVEHQINQIKEEKPWIIPVYNDEQTFFCDRQCMTRTGTVNCTTYIVQEVPVCVYDENGNIVNFKTTNIAYVKPHILKVKDNDYLIFENSDYVFINGYKDKIKFTNLCDYIKEN